MKKKLVALLSMTIVFGLTGCSSENGSDTVNENRSDVTSDADFSNESDMTVDDTFSAKDAIKIEDIDWNVTESVMDGERFVSFNYTNNSEYTILDVEMNFVQKSDVTKEQLSVFDELKEEREWTDEEVSDIYILGYNRKCAEPGETVSDSPCCINGTYTLVENIEQYEIMQPDMITIAFIGKDGKGYTTYYDFKNQTYGESSQGGIDIQEWSDSEISKLLPKAEAPAIHVSSDDEDEFRFEAYGVSRETYAKYVEAVKANGFTNIDYENNDSYKATNADGVEARIAYTMIEEKMTGYVEFESESESESESE